MPALPIPHRPRRQWTGIALATTVVLGSAAWLLAGCSNRTPDVSAVRQAVIHASGGGWKPQFELGIGSLGLGLIRASVALAEGGSDARDALRAVRSADVSVHRRFKRVAPRNPAAMLQQIDAAVAPLGWERMVTVIDRGEAVLVFTPSGTTPPTSQVQVCVAVMQSDELIVAAARSDLKPLLDLAWRHTPQIALAE